MKYTTNRKKGLAKLLQILAIAAVTAGVFQACNKDPYVPGSSAVIIGGETGDETYNNNNDAQPLLSTLKVMSYNIHILNPPSKPGETDIAATAKVIMDADPDFVFLQEVDKNSGRNGYSGDMAKDLGARTKMNQVFYSATSVGRGFYGVAILSKYPLRSVKKHLLTKENANTEQRVLGTAVLDLPGIDSVLLGATHLQHNSATNRLQQANDLVRILSPVSGKVIIGGDLNEMESATSFFNVFDGTFTRTCKGVGCPPTFSAQLPKSVIDYIAYRPASAFSVKSHKTISEYYASDHLPVLAELTINR